MKVIVDGSCWGGSERGVAASTRRLVSALARRDPSLVVGAFNEDPLAIDPQIPHLPCRSGRGARRAAWQQLRLPRRLRRIEADLLYCPSYTIPFASPLPSVVTVHDLIAIEHPRLCTRRNVVHYSALLGRSARAARRVAVPTEVVRRKVIERFAVPPERVWVVPWGVDTELSRPDRSDACETIRSSLGIEGRFALTIGCVEPKKDQRTAAQATARAGLPWVLAGPPSPQTPSLLPTILAAAGPDCRYLGFVSPEILSALYASATVMCFPSLAEGFGLPVLESMAAGTPVICSDLPVLRELCGDAAVYTAPGDVSALARALTRVVEHPSLWRELSERGRARASRFTWANSAEVFEELLRDAL